jgi:hypothetical protein
MLAPVSGFTLPLVYAMLAYMLLRRQCKLLLSGTMPFLGTTAQTIGGGGGNGSLVLVQVSVSTTIINSD